MEWMDSIDGIVTTDAAAAIGSAPRGRAAVIYNPLKVDVAHLRDLVARHEKEHGWGASEWFATAADDQGADFARRAARTGASVIAIAAGDGTVHAVAHALDEDGARLPIALIPSGTGNLLARNLGLRLGDMETAARAVFSGEDRAIDAVRLQIRHEGDTVTSHRFLVMAGVGIDAQMIVHTNAALKRRASSLAYVAAIRKAVRGGNRLRLRYRLDAGPVHGIRAHTLILGNGGYLTGNINLLPDAVMDDGVFDVVFLLPAGVVGWASVARKLFWENSVAGRSTTGRALSGLTGEITAVRYLRGRQLTVRFETPHTIELDGDVHGTAIGFRARIDPGGFVVRVPVA
jgi:Sphingosine kinase and enzymes related to eukaryotic diacylglycerol kinase